MDAIRLEILSYSYWEHFKFEKELAYVLPVSHAKRKRIRKETQKILSQIHAINVHP